MVAIISRLPLLLATGEIRVKRAKNKSVKGIHYKIERLRKLINHFYDNILEGEDNSSDDTDKQL